MQHKKKEKEGNNLNRHFSKDTEMGNKYMKRCSISPIISEMPTKTAIKYHLTAYHHAITSVFALLLLHANIMSKWYYP